MADIGVDDLVRPIDESQFLGALPPVRTVSVAEVTSAVAASERRVVVLDETRPVPRRSRAYRSSRRGAWKISAGRSPKTSPHSSS